MLLASAAAALCVAGSLAALPAFAEDPFSISVGGEPETQAAPRRDRPAPAAAPKVVADPLADVDVKISFDGLNAKPMLNVSTTPTRHSYRAGEDVRFLASTNYPGYIERAEVVISRQDGTGGYQVVERVPIEPNGEAAWTMPDGGDGEFAYVLRVYDAKGRFDETASLPLGRTSADFEINKERRTAVAPGMGEDRTARRNIKVHGGAVTVRGKNVPDGGSVTLFGETIPVDPSNAFVAQRILPPGNRTIRVAVSDAARREIEIEREVDIPQNDWFYVGLADATLGYRTGSAGIQTVRPGEYDKVYTRGRLAFYLKGKIKGEYLLTAAADTGDKPIGSLFRGLDEKDARAILRRIDPDDYYPVYGDDSTSFEDAPTQGKFYVRLERGDSHVMWGNYKTTIRNTKFLRSERALYGANAEYRSPETTSFGERRTSVTLYAAQPGTLPHRDVFRGTGGSAYFLKHQDITTGSETITAELRDPTTGLVTERVVLVEGADYDIDYMQGVLILHRTLPSITGTSDPVRSGAIGGNDVYLVAQYEYTPAAADVDGYVYGGRAEHWINDRIRVAVTGTNEKTETADQQAYGADILLRKSENTWIEAEIAQARGPGFSSSISTDGGLTNSAIAPAGNALRTAGAWRVKAEADLAEVSGGALKGRIGGYYEKREAGFETLTENVSVDQRIFGAHAMVEAGPRLTLGAKYDDYADAAGKIERTGKTTAEYRFDERWKLAAGVEYKEYRDPLASAPGYNGTRVDAGLRLEYLPDEDRFVYVFGQTTLARTGDLRRNDRIGVGGETRLTDKVSLSGEVSYGTTGLGALASVNYDPTADDHYYLGYRLDPDRAWENNARVLDGVDGGALVAGVKRRMSDTLTAFSEAELDMFGKKRSLAQTYGVTYSPSSLWTVTGGFEAGRIRDDSIDIATGLRRSDFDRKALSASVLYNDEETGLKARLRGEYRNERSTDGTRDLDTWMLGAGVSWDANPDWRFLANADVLMANAPGTSLRDGEYAEGSVAFAYRPVDNNRFNALFKYTYLYDLPGPDQVNISGDLLGPAQRSHILSADGNWNANEYLTLGAKYAMRIGDIRDRGTTIWTTSSAHLGVLRADIHVLRKWDLLLEGRVLYLPEIGNTDWGFLAAVYRHVGDNFKVGLGYNFGRFSDDLRDLTYDDQGVFVNVIGKF